MKITVVIDDAKPAPLVVVDTALQREYNGTVGEPNPVAGAMNETQRADGVNCKCASFIARQCTKPDCPRIK